MKLRIEIEIPLSQEEIKKMVKEKGETLASLSRKAGYQDGLLRDLLCRRDGAQYLTLRKLLLPLIDIKSMAIEAIERFFEGDKP